MPINRKMDSITQLSNLNTKSLRQLLAEGKKRTRMHQKEIRSARSKRNREEYRNSKRYKDKQKVYQKKYRQKPEIKAKLAEQQKARRLKIKLQNQEMANELANEKEKNRLCELKIKEELLIRPAYNRNLLKVPIKIKPCVQTHMSQQRRESQKKTKQNEDNKNVNRKRAKERRELQKYIKHVI